MDSLFDRIQACYQRQVATDKELIGDWLQVVDQSADFMSGTSCYWGCSAVAEVARPASIGEIGVRFGYSIKAIIAGCARASCQPPQVCGWDNESYEPGCLSIARNNLLSVLHPQQFQLTIVDTQQLDSLSCSDLDLFHVDGDHSAKGTLHDLELARCSLKPGGLLLLDDVDHIHHVRRAAIEFAIAHKLTPLYLPTMRGMFLYHIPTNTLEPFDHVAREH